MRDSSGGGAVLRGMACTDLVTPEQKRRYVLAVLLAAFTSACGALLGVDFDDVRPSTPTTFDAGAGQDVDEPDPPVEPPTPVGPDGTCAPDRKRCDALCVSRRDPAYGCDADGCLPCSIAHGLGRCVSGACAAQCNHGYRSCGGVCKAESATSCGASCTSCPVPANGSAVCSAGTCAIACDAGYSEEGGTCVLDILRERVSAGGLHTCGVRTDGTVACWGSDAYGQASPPAGTFRQVSAGAYSTCGVKTDGTVACWGNSGQSSAPAGTFRQVSAGNYSTCGVRTDGSLACWGSDGKAGVPTTGHFRQVSVGSRHTCGVRTDGTLACSGCRGQFDRTPVGTFSHVAVGRASSDATTGLCTSHGVKTDGSLASWEVSWVKNVGTYFTESVPLPGSFLQVSSRGGVHSCALRADNTVSCWGNNASGQATPPEDTFRQVSAGTGHTCGVKTDGTVVCWGSNEEKQATPPSGTFW